LVSEKTASQDFGGGVFFGPRQHGGNPRVDVEEVVGQRMFPIEVQTDPPGEGVTCEKDLVAFASGAHFGLLPFHFAEEWQDEAIAGDLAAFVAQGSEGHMGREAELVPLSGGKLGDHSARIGWERDGFPLIERVKNEVSISAFASSARDDGQVAEFQTS